MTVPATVDITGLSLGEHHVRRFTLREELHRPWSATVELASTDSDLDLERAIGAAVRIDLPHEPFVPVVHGLLLDVRQLTVEPGGESTYLLEVGAKSSLLALRRAQRIFRDASVLDVAGTLMTEHGLSGVEVRVVEPHPAREYRVQWKESDLDLVQRLLAEEGVTLVHDPRSDGLRCIDDSTSGTDLLPYPLPVRPDAETLRDPEEPPCIRRVGLGRTLTTGGISTRDYDFENPEYVPETFTSFGSADREGALEAYEAQVGQFRDPAGAALVAVRRLESARREARVLELETNAIVNAGVRVVVAGGPRSGIDGEVLVVASETTWTREARRTDLRCVPAAQRFRPARRAKPRIAGTQTAFVVTGGEEIDVDEHGRVEVEFRWDRRDLRRAGASRRVRVSQPWAGPGYGMTLIPRRGEEVIVSYVDGDPDEPIVVGRVHNGLFRDPLTLPGQQTQSIWKSRSVPGTPDQYNMIRMEDAAGSEMLELRAQRDSRSETLRNAETVVGVDESKKVGGSSKTEVAGAYSLKSGSTSIGTGAYNVSASSITMHATGDIKETSGGNHTIDTGGFWVSAKGVAQISAKKIVLMAGGSNITLTPGGITITSSGPVDVHGSPIKLNC